MDAILLVGGRGTRLQPLVSNRPKPMAPVAGRPFLEWMLLSLKWQGVYHVILATGYLGEQIQNYFGEGRQWGLSLSYSHEKEPLGTGGALIQALQYVRGSEFLTLNGDSYCPLDVNTFHSFHQNKKSLFTLWLTRLEETSRYGTVELKNTGEILSFKEKTAASSAGLINTGIYCIHPSILKGFERNTFYSLEKDILPQCVGKGLYGLEAPGPFIDIGTPESYQEAEAVLKMEFEKLKGSSHG